MVDSLFENYTNSEKKMPQNLEAEQSLLGSILFDNKILERIHLVESFPELASLQDKDRCDVACAQKLSFSTIAHLTKLHGL